MRITRQDDSNNLRETVEMAFDRHSPSDLVMPEARDALAILTEKARKYEDIALMVTSELETNDAMPDVVLRSIKTVIDQ